MLSARFSQFIADAGLTTDAMRRDPSLLRINVLAAASGVGAGAGC